jgi:hypothetical protein
MLPADLNADHFKRYLPRANALAVQYLETLKRLPLAFVPSLLHQIIEYDYQFPAERRELEKQLNYLQGLSGAQLSEVLSGFEHIAVSQKLEKIDWSNSPEQFVEELSAHLWATNQMDAFRVAAEAYAEASFSAIKQDQPPIPRLTVVAIGQGVSGPASYELFRQLRRFGIHFSNVNPAAGLTILLNAVSARARAAPVPYAHWYVDGDEEADHDSGLTVVSYHGLRNARAALLAKMHAEIESGATGPEGLRTKLANLEAQELGLHDSGDPILSHFNVRLLTTNSGTQIFSTTFAELAAKEVLRRAQPLTLFVRFAPRQKQRPMNDLLSVRNQSIEVDPLGSLIDAEMGAYYIWLNEQRLSGSIKSSFLVWFEDHNQALMISPSAPRGTESSNAYGLRELLALATG